MTLKHVKQVIQQFQQVGHTYIRCNTYVHMSQLKIFFVKNTKHKLFNNVKTIPRQDTWYFAVLTVPWVK